MSLEDYTSYTEVDNANDRIQVAENHIDHNAWRNEFTAVYKDKGAGHFGNFEHLVQAKTDFLVTLCLGHVWAMSNNINDIKTHIDNGWQFLETQFYRSDVAGKKIIKIRSFDGVGANPDEYNGVVENTWYYLTIDRNGAQFRCKIYSDSDRTNLLATLLVVCIETTFRYIYACNTSDTGNGIQYNNDIENLDLQEGPPVGGGMLEPIKYWGKT